MAQQPSMEPRNTVIKIIAETFNIPYTEIHDDSKLIDIAKDSIALFELLIRLEKTFERRVKYEDIAHIETVGDIVAYVNTLSHDH